MNFLKKGDISACDVEATELLNRRRECGCGFGGGGRGGGGEETFIDVGLCGVESGDGGVEGGLVGGEGCAGRGSSCFGGCELLRGVSLD